MGYKYRKKSVEVEAFQWRANQPESEVPEWVAEGLRDGRLCRYSDLMIIATVGGDMVVTPGHWIIRESYGLFHSCDPRNFKSLYEPIDDE